MWWLTSSIHQIVVVGFIVSINGIPHNRNLNPYLDHSQHIKNAGIP